MSFPGHGPDGSSEMNVDLLKVVTGGYMRCLEHNLENLAPYLSNDVAGSQKRRRMEFALHIPPLFIQPVRPNLGVEQ